VNRCKPTLPSSGRFDPVDVIDVVPVGAILPKCIEAIGASVFPGYPSVNKVVEPRLIGRQHPGTSTQTASSP
jgi:hypothetical protein